MSDPAVQISVHDDSAAPPEKAWVTFWRDYKASPMAVAMLALLAMIVAVAVLAPWLSPQNPYDLMQLDFMDGLLPPGSVSESAGFTFWLGADDQGRDTLSAIMHGLRTSLLVGFVSAVLACFIGSSLGLFAAYRGGRTETLIMRLVDLQLSFPTILVALMILAFLGKGVSNVILALVIVEWATYARTSRSSALVEARKEYVDAANSLGLPHYRIIFRHLLPNCLTPIIVIGTVQIARAISLEATLSFLGLGVPVTEPSLGLLIANGYRYMFSGEYWLSLYPGLALLITIVAINIVGDRLRDVFNPKGDA
jgi:peptide/nickel transport system permease protein